MHKRGSPRTVYMATASASSCDSSFEDKLSEFVPVFCCCGAPIRQQSKVKPTRRFWSALCVTPRTARNAPPSAPGNCATSGEPRQPAHDASSIAGCSHLGSLRSERKTGGLRSRPFANSIMICCSHKRPHPRFGTSGMIEMRRAQSPSLWKNHFHLNRLPMLSVLAHTASARL
jgi:hypothetical protein